MSARGPKDHVGLPSVTRPRARKTASAPSGRSGSSPASEREDGAEDVALRLADEQEYLAWAQAALDRARQWRACMSAQCRRHRSCQNVRACAAAERNALHQLRAFEALADLQAVAAANRVDQRPQRRRCGDGQ